MCLFSGIVSVATGDDSRAEVPKAMVFAVYRSKPFPGHCRISSISSGDEKKVSSAIMTAGQRLEVIS